MKSMAFILMIFSSLLFAEGSSTSDRHQMGLKVADIKVADIKLAGEKEESLSKYTDEGDFLKLFGTMVTNSSTYRMFISYLGSSPVAYKASIDAVEINELKKINVQLTQLIEQQKLLKKLFQSREDFMTQKTI